MYEKSCFVLLTNRCNMQCPHCYNMLDPIKSNITKEEDKLSFKQLSFLFSELIKNGFTKVLFSGGEALLRTDIFEIIKEANYKGLNTALFSNGHMLSEETIKELGRSGLKEIRISFNEMVWAKGRKQYEYIFNKQIKSLPLLKNAGISVGYVYIISGYNIDYTYEAYEKIRKLGATMKIQPLYIPKDFNNYEVVSAYNIPLSKWKKLKENFSQSHSSDITENKKISSVYGAKEEIIRYIDFLIETYNTKEKPSFCPTGPILVIDSDGVFHPCLFRYDIDCGNISKKEDVININEILNRYKNLSNATCYHEECLSAFR